MNSRIIKWFGIVLILEAGFLHFVASQAAYLRAAYLGYMLVAHFAGTLAAAAGIYYKKSWGWILGGLLSLASLTGYVLNCTIGLPQLAPAPWLYPYSIVAGVSEILFLLLAMLRPWKMIDVSAVSSAHSIMFLFTIPIIVGLVAFPAYQWDTYASQVGYHHHVGSLQTVCSTPATSLSELQERYGIQLSLVAISMMDGVVDVRLKVLDPDKASPLLKNQAALLVDQQFLVLAPHMHQHFMLKRNKIHTMFFPALNRKIHAGSQVSLVFGAVRIEPVVVR